MKCLFIKKTNEALISKVEKHGIYNIIIYI